MTSIDRNAPTTIPMLDLAPLHAPMRAQLDAAIARVVDSNTFVMGEAVREFERDAADYLGCRHAIGVASGTDALLLSLKAAGIGEGDEIITTAFTFFGTVEAILHAGARPVFADIEPRSMLLDPAAVEARVTPATRAILPVHLYGQVADMPAILDIAQRKRLTVIEDAAQSFGARLMDKAAGSFGLAGSCSFHPAKPLGAFGDGGMIVSNDDTFADRVRQLRNHGAAARYRHAFIGFNSRLDSLQAAVLQVKLRYLDAHLAERDRLAKVYTQLLADLPIELPQTLPQRRHCHAQYTVRVAERDRVREQLAARGIASAIHYPLPVYRQAALADRYPADFTLPVTEATAGSCLSLPLYEGLDEEMQQRVADALREVLALGSSAREPRQADSAHP